MRKSRRKRVQQERWGRPETPRELEAEQKREEAAEPAGDEPSGDEVLGSEGDFSASDIAPEGEVLASDMAAEALELPEDVLATLRDEGWGGAPFVEHEGLIVGSREIYEIAENLGAAHQLPRTSLSAVFAEAGLNIDEVADLPEPNNPSREFFEDYLRELPRHIRDKYEI